MGNGSFLGYLATLFGGHCRARRRGLLVDGTLTKGMASTRNDRPAQKGGARTVQTIHSLGVAALVALAFYLGWALMDAPSDPQRPIAVPAAGTGARSSH